MTHPSWVSPRAWLSFIELDKAVVLVWLDWLVFCEYGFSVFALWCPLATPTILLGFLLLWALGISSWLIQQSAAIAPYLGQGVSPHRCPSWPSMWDSSSRPSCTHASMAPWTWGWFSQPPPLALGLGAWHSSSQPRPLTLDAGYILSATPPDLGRGVAPLGPSCTIAVWYSRPLTLTSDVVNSSDHCPLDMGSSRLLPLTSDVG